MIISAYIPVCMCVIHYNIFHSVIVKPPYEVTETGWGEFEVVIKIFFNDPNERPVICLFCLTACNSDSF